MRHFDPWIDDLNRRFPRRQPEPPYRDRTLLYGVVLFLLLIALCLISGFAHGQTVSPVIVESRGPRVKGEVTFSNDQLVPLSLVIEPKTVKVVSGVPLYLHLESGVSVKLDTSSARLGPRQRFVVGYEIQCAAMPCAVSLQGTFTGLHTRDGLAIALHLPHVVYICAKQKGCRDEVRKSWGVS